MFWWCPKSWQKGGIGYAADGIVVAWRLFEDERYIQGHEGNIDVVSRRQRECVEVKVTIRRKQEAQAQGTCELQLRKHAPLPASQAIGAKTFSRHLNTGAQMTVT